VTNIFYFNSGKFFVKIYFYVVVIIGIAKEFNPSYPFQCPALCVIMSPALLHLSGVIISLLSLIRSFGCSIFRSPAVCRFFSLSVLYFSYLASLSTSLLPCFSFYIDPYLASLTTLLLPSLLQETGILNDLISLSRCLTL